MNGPRLTDTWPGLTVTVASGFSQQYVRNE